MARVCIDRCERDEYFIQDNLTSNGFGDRICCCYCPALEKCKELDDDIGCPYAMNDTYNQDTCINCKYCTDENNWI